MMTVAELWRRARYLFQRDRATRELEEEMRLHVTLRAERYEEIGMRSAPAAEAARRQFGNRSRLVERSRDAWGGRWLEIAAQDARYAARGLRRNVGFTVVVVATLAIGLGVNAAIFSLLDRLFVSPPGGVAAPEQLRRVYLTQSWGDREVTTRDQFSYPQVTDLRDALGSSVAMATYAADSIRLGDADAERFVTVAYTSAAYWSVLGVRPAIGRTFTADEARIETPTRIAVISDGFWRRRLAMRRDVLGQTIVLGGNKYVVVGVAPPRFTGVDLAATDLWLPLGNMPMDQFGNRMWYQVRGVPLLRILLRPSPFQLGALSQRMTQGFRAGSVAGGYANDSSAFVSVGSIIAALGPMAPHQEVIIATRLAWVSVLVLLIAAANVANLLLTRLLDRRREMALRLALGVSRTRLAVQLLIESLMLGGMGAIAALVLGQWAGMGLRRTLMPDVHWVGSVIEWRLVVATVLVALMTAIVIGLVPVAHVHRFVSAEALKSGERATPHAGRRVRSALVVGQAALAVILLTGAGLFVESLRHVLAVNVGYDVSHVVFAEPTMIGSRGGEDAALIPALGAGLEEAARRLAGAPGVEGVALASHAPMAGYYMTSVHLPGRDSTPQLDGSPPGLLDVSPEYWGVTGIHAVRGRLTNDFDRTGAELVAVVNETMARTLWPGRDPIGQCVIVYLNPASKNPDCRVVVGVVPDAHLVHIVEPPRMQLYLPLSQASLGGSARHASAIVIRAAPARAALVTELARRTLRETLPNAELHLQDMQQLLSPQFRPWRLGALLFTALGMLALLVAAIGLYGVIAYGVRRRTHELGIRIALGAQRARISRLVVGEGVRMVAGGVFVGAALALVSVRFVGSLLYDTSLRDPLVLAGVVIVMLATAFSASWIPAWRAGRVDPMVALRGE